MRVCDGVDGIHRVCEQLANPASAIATIIPRDDIHMLLRIAHVSERGNAIMITASSVSGNPADCADGGGCGGRASSTPSKMQPSKSQNWMPSTVSARGKSRFSGFTSPCANPISWSVANALRRTAAADHTASGSITWGLSPVTKSSRLQAHILQQGAEECVLAIGGDSPAADTQASKQKWRMEKGACLTGAYGMGDAVLCYGQA